MARRAVAAAIPEAAASTGDGVRVPVAINCWLLPCIVVAVWERSGTWAGAVRVGGATRQSINGEQSCFESEVS